MSALPGSTVTLGVTATTLSRIASHRVRAKKATSAVSARRSSVMDGASDALSLPPPRFEDDGFLEHETPILLNPRRPAPVRRQAGGAAAAGDVAEPQASVSRTQAPASSRNRCTCNIQRSFLCGGCSGGRARFLGREGGAHDLPSSLTH